MEMKRTIFNRVKALTVLFMAACLLTVALCPVQAKAAMFEKTVKYSKSTTNINTIASTYRDYILDMGKKMNTVTGLKVTSSNESVIRITSYTPYNPNIIRFQARKAGKATITVSGTTNNASKPLTYKCKFKVVAYQNPIKTLKLGRKKVNDAFKRYPMATLKNKKKQLMLEITPTSGWTIKKIRTESYSRETTTDPIVKTVKNKTSFKIKADGKHDEYLVITMYNKKLKMTEELALTLNSL